MRGDQEFKSIIGADAARLTDRETDRRNDLAFDAALEAAALTNPLEQVVRLLQKQVQGLRGRMFRHHVGGLAIDALSERLDKLEAEPEQAATHSIEISKEEPAPDTPAILEQLRLLLESPVGPMDERARRRERLLVLIERVVAEAGE